MKRPFVAPVLVLLACANPAGPSGGGLAVRAVPPALELVNRSAAPVYYFAIERGAAAFTDWAPCTDPSRCAAIATGRTASVPYGEITGYAPGAREAIVYWWHLVPGAQATSRPDSVRSVLVGL
jgi:hypothetical protein